MSSFSQIIQIKPIVELAVELPVQLLVFMCMICENELIPPCPNKLSVEMRT